MYILKFISRIFLKMLIFKNVNNERIVMGFTIVSVWIRFIQYWQVLVITRVAGE